MPTSSWEQRQRNGGTRRVCMTCGVHALVVGGTTPFCTCCGESDLRPVAEADARLAMIHRLPSRVSPA